MSNDFPSPQTNLQRISDANTINFNFTAYVFSLVAGVTLLLVGRGIILLGIGRNAGALVLPGLVFVMISVAVLIVNLVFWCMLHYHLWKVVPRDIARTTPGKAVGLTFIPLFNFYWVFVSCLGLSKDINKTLQQQGIQYRVSEGLERIRN